MRFGFIVGTNMVRKRNTMTKCYSELIKIKNFRERYEYLKLGGRIGEETFGYNRYLNQQLYKSLEWKRTRDQIIIRDTGCDLAHFDRPIPGKIIVHHINPISKEDIINRSYRLFDEENLVCVSHITHEAIHYGDSKLLIEEYTPRRPNDTCPWRSEYE